MGVAGSKEHIEKIWPLRSDKKVSGEPRHIDKDLWEKIKRIHNVK